MNTELMNKVFSEATSDSYKDGISDAIDEARINGVATYSDFGEQLVFAEVDGDVVIEDKSNGEVTVSKEGGVNGDHKLEAANTSATVPDVLVPRATGRDGDEIENSASDVAVTIKPAITNPDKAGLGKNYSLSFDGFNSPEEANDFYSDLCDTVESQDIYSDALDDLSESSLTFSDDELEDIAFSATELHNDCERLAGNGDMDLAVSIMDRANQLHAYSVLATEAGHDTSDLTEATAEFSDFASNEIDDIVAETPVTELFSEMSDDQIDNVFSNVDEDTADVLYSIVDEGDDTLTFSDVDDIVEQNRYDMELDTPILAVYSDEDELNDLFSDMNEEDANTVYSALSEDEDLTFSDANEILDEMNTPILAVYSNEDELNDLFSDMDEDEVDAMYSALEENEDLTFSEANELLDYVNEFSDDDACTLAENANQLYSAYEDMMYYSDTDLAEQVYDIAQMVYADAEKAERCGHCVEDVRDSAAKIAEDASDVATDPAAKYKTEVAKAIADDGVIDKSERRELNEKKEDLGISNETAAKAEDEAKQDVKDGNSDKCDTYADIYADTDAYSDDFDANYSDYEDLGESRIFSDSTSAPVAAINSCLTSPIN